MSGSFQQHIYIVPHLPSQYIADCNAINFSSGKACNLKKKCIKATDPVKDSKWNYQTYYRPCLTSEQLYLYIINI